MQYEAILTLEKFLNYKRLGKIDASSAVSDDPSDCYGLGRDINHRLCLCAIGQMHFLKNKGE